MATEHQSQATNTVAEPIEEDGGYAKFKEQYIASEYMMTSLHGKEFRIAGPLRGNSSVYRWLTLTKGC